MNDLESLVVILTNRNKTIATMESCTGGGLANAITNVQGASNVLKYSAVTYSDEYKIKMGVNKETIDNYSVYSNETANEMSKAISNFANADYGVGITGIINSIAYISIYERKQNNYYNYSIELNDSVRAENKSKIISLIVCRLVEIVSFDN